MRLILSRKGFDSGSGGCPSPIFPDGSMISLPIPEKTSPIRYDELNWRGRNLGDLVNTLSRGKQLARYRAHLDPDLREDSLQRNPGWRPSLGQVDKAQGHLRNEGVAVGDVFLFFGLFRRVDEAMRWVGRPRHVVWGWLQIGEIASVDDDIRGAAGWAWLGDHPHLRFEVGRTNNTLYVASERLELPTDPATTLPPAGTFDRFAPDRCLTAREAPGSSLWSLPRSFFPYDRLPLSFHRKPHMWSLESDRALLRTVGRGQEFVLDLDHYPEVARWLSDLLHERHG
jgi:hypothetical protein